MIDTVRYNSVRCSTAQKRMTEYLSVIEPPDFESRSPLLGTPPRWRLDHVRRYSYPESRRIGRRQPK